MAANPSIDAFLQDSEMSPFGNAFAEASFSLAGILPPLVRLPPQAATASAATPAPTKAAAERAATPESPALQLAQSPQLAAQEGAAAAQDKPQLEAFDMARVFAALPRYQPPEAKRKLMPASSLSSTTRARIRQRIIKAPNEQQQRKMEAVSRKLTNAAPLDNDQLAGVGSTFAELVCSIYTFAVAQF